MLCGRTVLTLYMYGEFHTPNSWGFLRRSTMRKSYRFVDTSCRPLFVSRPPWPACGCQYWIFQPSVVASITFELPTLPAPTLPLRAVEVLFCWPSPYQVIRSQPLCCQVIMFCTGELVSHFRNPAILYEVQLYSDVSTFYRVNIAMLTCIGRHALFCNMKLTVRSLRENCYVAVSMSEQLAVPVCRVEDGNS
jgi:hypothetical protein